VAAGVLAKKYPILAIFFGCCALAITATASNAPANRIDANEVFFNSRLISSHYYHADDSEEKRYVRVLLIELKGGFSINPLDEKGGVPAGTGGMKARGLH
jgi:hypothetical protein